MKNAKFFGYHFYMDTNIQGDFQICISVPLMVSMTSSGGFIINFELILHFFLVFYR